MSKSYITSIEALPAEAREFVDFLRDLVTNSPEFINAFLPELERYRYVERPWECEGETYLNDYLNASADWSSGNDYFNEYNKLITNFISGYGACGFAGCYRIAIVFENCDYVIKFPIRSRDCCLVECQNYNAALEAELDHYFVNTYNLGPLDFFKEKGYNGNIYIQKKITTVVEKVTMDDNLDEYFWSYGPEDEDGERYFKEGFFNEEDLLSFEAFMNEYYISMLDYRGILFYMWLHRPEEEIVRLNNFLEDSHINDIHPHNAGFLTADYNTCPVIIDFAGC